MRFNSLLNLTHGGPVRLRNEHQNAGFPGAFPSFIQSRFPALHTPISLEAPKFSNAIALGLSLCHSRCHAA